MNKSVVFQCPLCGQEYEGSTEDFGAEFVCEKCGKTFPLNSTSVHLDSVKRRRPSGFECWLNIYRQYFSFRGRMSRRSFWWAILFQMILWFAILVINELTEDETLIIPIFLFATISPTLAAVSRRLHDTNKSAWWILLNPVPVLGLALLAWLLSCGDKGRNRFGSGPET